MDLDPQDSTVILRDTEDADGTRYLDATIDAKGRLVIEGQDVGGVVEKKYGEGYREYEWRWTLAPEEIPAAMAVLDGEPDEAPLAVVSRWIGVHGTDPGTAIRLGKVRIELWSRLGD